MISLIICYGWFLELIRRYLSEINKFYRNSSIQKMMNKQITQNYFQMKPFYSYGLNKMKGFIKVKFFMTLCKSWNRGTSLSCSVSSPILILKCSSLAPNPWRKQMRKFSTTYSKEPKRSHKRINLKFAHQLMIKFKKEKTMSQIIKYKTK